MVMKVNYVNFNHYLLRSFGTIGGYIYKSIILQVDLKKPVCECVDWAIYRLPCKHMWAAMERDWEKLPQNYRDCLEFRFDGRAEVIVRIESNFNIETGNAVPTELNFSATSIIINPYLLIINQFLILQEDAGRPSVLRFTQTQKV